ncbi:MAG: hypothetical protein ABJA66_11815 [Actinomycetota bacterium]
MAGTEESIIREIARLLMESGKATDWMVAMKKRAEAVKLIKDNLSLIKYVNVAELNQKLRAAGCTAKEVQQIIRGVSVARNLVVAGEVTAEVGTFTAASTESAGFLTIAGVTLTATEAAVVVGVILAIAVACIAFGWVLSKLFFGGNNRMARTTIDEYAHPYKLQVRFLGVVH